MTFFLSFSKGIGFRDIFRDMNIGDERIFLTYYMPSKQGMNLEVCILKYTSPL